MSLPKAPISYFITFLSLLTFTVNSVNAQSSKNDQLKGSAATLIEEIMVVAQKKTKEESLQDVPVAITAVSGQQIEAMFAEDLRDIGLSAPNVSLDEVGTVPAVANFSIRGMGFLSSIPSDEPTVGVFVDGMYLGVNYGVLTDFFDLDSVEVLRGPQGTLFGRNVTGGAVLITSRRPDDKFGLQARGTFGSDNRRDLAAAVEGPVGNKLNVRLAVMVKDHDGYFDNLTIPGDEIGEENTKIVRPSLQFNATDNLDISLIGEYGQYEGDGARTRHRDDPTVLPTAVFGYSPPQDKFDLTHDFQSSTETEWKSLVAEAFWTFDNGSLKSVTAWRGVMNRFGMDLDGTNFPIFVGADNSGLDQDQFSQEFIYSGQITDAVSLTTGLYYFTQDVTYLDHRQIPILGVDIAGKGQLKHETYAIYAQSDITLSEKWSLLLGGRLTKEDKKATVSSAGFCATDFSSCIVDFEDEKDFSNFSPKIGLSWKSSDDLHVYGSYTRGFRSGGFNLRNQLPSNPGPYDEEKVSAFELGLKYTFMDDRARINLAAFYNDYSDLQRTVLDPATVAQQILNAAEATTKGVELELAFLVTNNFAINASLGVLDAAYDSFDGLDVTGDGVPDPSLAKKLDLARAPELTGHINAVYDVPLASGMVTFQGSYSYTDERPANDTNTFFLDSYTLANASITYSHAENWRVSVFGKNLLNEAYADTGVHASVFSILFLNPPRTWGIEVLYEY